MQKPEKMIVRFSYVEKATGLSRAACYREMQRNPKFPKRIKLGESAVGFDIQEVDAYVAEIIKRGSIFVEEKGQKLQPPRPRLRRG